MSRGKSKQLPKNWPVEDRLEFLVNPKFSKTVTLALRKNLNAWTSETKDDNLLVISPPAPNHLVRITSISSPDHPACGQHGLFAMRALPSDSLIILYLGLFHTDSDTDPASDYDLSMDHELGVSVDASQCGNEARFINDYRGVAERPNAEFRDCWIHVGASFERRIGVFVKKDCRKGIGKGREILVSYGKGFWNERRAVD